MVALALAASACGQADPQSPEVRSEAGLRSYAPPPGLSPEETVRSYVDALNGRDGIHFCGLIAPYIAGRFEIPGRDPEGVFRGRMGCAKLVSTFIGYIEDCCPPKFLRATVEELDVGRERRGLVAVRLRLDVLFEDTATHRRKTEPLADTVWVAHFRDGWRVAKMSALAHAASIGGIDESEDVSAAPDLATEGRRYASELREYRGQLRARRASYGPTGKLAACEGGVAVDDRGGDLADHASPASKTAPRAPQLDLRRLTVRSRDGSICLEYETAGPLEGPADFDFNLRDSPAGTGYIQVFHIELRADGSARVTSGEDDDDHPITVPARIGRDANRLTVVLDRASIDAGQPTPMSQGHAPLDRFVFQAGVTGSVAPGRELRDELGPPRSLLSYSYPAGEPCRLDDRVC